MARFMLLSFKLSKELLLEVTTTSWYVWFSVVHYNHMLFCYVDWTEQGARVVVTDLTDLTKYYPINSTGFDNNVMIFSMYR